MERGRAGNENLDLLSDQGHVGSEGVGGESKFDELA